MSNDGTKAARCFPDREASQRRTHLMTRTVRRSLPSLVALAAVVLTWMGAGVSGQGRPGSGDWSTYGGDLASRRYRPFDQINRANFNDLEVAWRFKADAFGPRPEFNFQATPLVVNGVLYTPAGTRRAVVALDAGTGEMLWMHREDEGKRGEAAPRRLSGRGLAYWTDGKEERIVYVTPGYQMIALDAKTGRRVPGFGNGGAVDLKLDMDQTIDPETGEVGLHAAPIIANDVIVVGAAHLPGGVPKSRVHEKGYIRGYDVRTGKRLWIFHTLPQRGEFGNETWEQESWEYTGNVGVWAQMSADEELGMVYLPVELPTGDYYGGHRPGAGLFGESLVALDLKTGRLKWFYQLVHHGIWDFDIPAAPILADITVNGKAIKAIAQPTKQNWWYVFDRATGQPVWPIEERPVPKGDVPGEWYVSDAAVRDEAARVRSARPGHRRSHRLHAGATSGSGQAGLALQDRAALHASACQQMGRSARAARWSPRPRAARTGRAAPSIPRPTSLHLLFPQSQRDRVEQRSRAIGHGVHQRPGTRPERSAARRWRGRCRRRRWRGWRSGSHVQGLPLLKPPYGTYHCHRPEQGRDRLEGRPWRDARRGSEPSGAEGAEHPAHRPAERAHRHARDAEPGDCW